MNIREINKKFENFIRNYRSINEIFNQEEFEEFENTVNKYYRISQDLFHYVRRAKRA